MKKPVKETLVPYLDIEGSVDNFIKYLLELKVKYPLHELEIDKTYDYESCEISVIGTRLETDKEEQDRLIEEAKVAEQKRIRAEKRMAAQIARMEKMKQEEAELYNKLKAKYEER